MRHAEALASIETTERAWREFVRLDPGNAISWSNLAVAYLIKGNILETMGRLGDAAAASRAALELDHQVTPNVMFRQRMALLAGRLAALEALRGNARQAGEALALGDQYRVWIAEHLPAGSYERSVQPVVDHFWRTQVAWSSGDHRRAIQAGREFTTKLEPLAPPGDAERFDKARWLSWAYFPLADSAYATGDFETAERAILRSLELRRTTPGLDGEMGDRRDTANHQATAALVLARRNRHDEAVAHLTPALKFQRGLAARGRDDPSQRVDLANALFVAASIGVGDRSSQLAEASVLLDKLPPELKRATSVNVLRERIAEEAARRRQP
jgi:tetratricopeptide (TPR) repeat protein